MNLIILIILGVVIWFLIDRNKLHNKIQAEGGMKRKYAELLKYLLKEPEARITGETNDSLQIEYKTSTSYVKYYLFQTFDMVMLSCTLRTPVHGEISKKWEFPLNTDQSLIFKKASQDMIQFANDNANWDTKQAQKIIDDFIMDENVIYEGLGINGVVLDSSIDSAISKYGSNYTETVHGQYSVEINYKEEGILFYYKYNDPLKKIFSIRFMSPFAGKTVKGIRIGDLVLIANEAYGKHIWAHSNANDFYTAVYDDYGIQIRTPFDPQSAEEYRMFDNIAEIVIVNHD